MIPPFFAGLLVCALGAAVLGGWFVDVRFLKQVLPGMTAMQPLTAACFVLSGASVAAAARLLRPLAAFLMLPVAVLALAVALQYATGSDFGIDGLLFAQAVLTQQPAHPHPGRMAEATAAMFLLLSTSILALTRRPAKRGLRALASNGATLGLSICVVVLIANIIGSPAERVVGASANMALHTAAGLSVLFAAVAALAQPPTSLARLYALDLPVRIVRQLRRLHAGPAWVRYSGAVALTWLVLEARIASGGLEQGYQLFPFVTGVLVTAILLGTGPAVLGAVLSTLLVNLYFLEPHGGLIGSDPGNAVLLTVFLATLLASVTILEVMLRALDRVEQDAGELARTSALLQLISQSSPDMIYAKDLQSRILYANAASAEVIGRPLGQIVGHSDLDWAANHAEAQAILENDRRVMGSAETLDMDEVFTGKDGQTRHYRSVKAPLRNADGTIIGLVGITSDVTDRRMAEERERLLAREVDHRAKNLLAVVQSVVQLTRADDAASLKTAINGRIHSLARAHSLLARARWEGVNFRQLVDEELAAFSGTKTRVRVEGPPLHLKPEVAQSLALVVHELATNAAKYGALSKESGEVEIRWSLEEDKAKNSSFEFCWHEQGGPEVARPKQKGFGSTVIRSTIERQLRGTVSLDWRVDGLLCTLTVPADHLTVAPNQKVSPKPDPGHSEVDARKENLTERRRVLIAEDEALIAAHLEQVLAEAGHHVIGPASDVGGAVKLVLTEDLDFAVLDVNLGGEDSFPVADVLAGKGVPFVFSTGYAGSVELPERLREAAVVAKPIDTRELLRLINTSLEVAAYASSEQG